MKISYRKIGKTTRKYDFDSETVKDKRNPVK